MGARGGDEKSSANSLYTRAGHLLTCLHAGAERCSDPHRPAAAVHLERIWILKQYTAAAGPTLSLWPISGTIGGTRY